MAKVHRGEEILPKASTPSIGCTNVTDRQTKDGFTIVRLKSIGLLSTNIKHYKFFTMFYLQGPVGQGLWGPEHLVEASPWLATGLARPEGTVCE